MSQDRTTQTCEVPTHVKLRLLGMSDLHAHLRGYDYHRGIVNETVGLTRLATLVRQARSEAANTLLFDNGDTLQGTPLGDLAMAHETDSAPNPMIDAFGQLGVDAATIGNHEFNYGLEALQRSYRTAAFPVVCANVATTPGTTPAQDATLFPPWSILDRTVTDAAGHPHPLRIGVIGAVPPQIMNWDEQHLAGRVHVRGIVESLRAHVPAMRRAGADIVVVLCHSGLGEDTDAPHLEQAATAVARIPGIDAVIAGHAHRCFPGPDYEASAAIDPVAGRVHGIPMAMPGAWGSHLALIDLDLCRDATGTWTVHDTHSTLRPIRNATATGAPCTTPEDPRLLDHSAAAHNRTLQAINRPIGTVPRRMHSYFAMLEAGPAQAVIATASRTGLLPLLRDTQYADLPVLAATSPFKSGGTAGPGHFTDVGPGHLRLRHITDLYLFPNSLRAVLIDGAGVRAWLDRSASAYYQIQPGQREQPLWNPAMPGYEYDTIFGLSYAIDLARPPVYDAATGALLLPGQTRIRDLTHQGRPVQDTDRFIIATSNYRSGGGGNFPGVVGRSVVAESVTSLRDILAETIANGIAPADLTPADWSFCPLDATSVLLCTSPDARGAPADIARLGLRDRGDTASGFAVFEMDLRTPAVTAPPTDEHAPRHPLRTG